MIMQPDEDKLSEDSPWTSVKPVPGTVVWVRRRNGSWWPGRIICKTELGASHLSSARSGTPVKLLGRREDASVDWYNIEKSKRVKPFRCGEFDECIERAKSTGSLNRRRQEKYARRKDAILDAIELERQQMDGLNATCEVVPVTKRPRPRGKPRKFTESVVSYSGNGYDLCSVSANALPASKTRPSAFRKYRPSAFRKYPLKTTACMPTTLEEEQALDLEEEGTGLMPRMRGLQDLVSDFSILKNKISDESSLEGTSETFIDTFCTKPVVGDHNMGISTGMNGKLLVKKKRSSGRPSEDGIFCKPSQKNVITCQTCLMEQLNVDSWDRCKELYPIATSDERIIQYAPNFEGWSKKNNDLPEGFMHLVRTAREERTLADRRVVDVEPSGYERFSMFDQNNFFSIVHGDCTKLPGSIKPQDFTLVIADLPYGFKLKDSRYDDQPFKNSEFNAFVDGIKQVTTAKHWRLVVFHSSMQSGLVEATFKNHFGSPMQAGYENMVWYKTNINYHGGGPRLLSKVEYLHVAYWSFDGKRTMEHFNTTACQNFSNVLEFPAVLQKLQDPNAQGRIVNHYQKPQKLINHILDMFSRPGDWVLDAFSGSGTTIACALKKGRNCVAVDIDKEAVDFIKMRLSALPTLPDENQELGAKSSSDFTKMTSFEIQPPFTSSLEDEATFAELKEVALATIPEETVDTSKDETVTKEQTAETDKAGTSKQYTEDFDLDL